ncbi:DHH family phosphoesterase [Methylomonas methanica]|uniref:Acetyltransferase n=1 Tax=Methylomonas methanica (strain DSM 25384 / MC09) TaxID=857087 RepID=F9ZYJ0_METMM|nr:DHH family phosphoesterase [Methylomonas methanica]AEG02262.1 hypothetical protein Metme_3908 [Methylomonas methanica MC09]
MNFDVFNGDADGICALLQLRLAEPADSMLITGVKRDISLLKRVDAKAGDRVNVLDISLNKNRQALVGLLERQVEIFYVDHHQAHDIPEHPKLRALINTDANVCTSLLVDQYLGHQYTAWAVTAAFGDNLDSSALLAAQRLNLSEAPLRQLKELGTCINYNAYGESIEDLHFSPDNLYSELYGFQTPFEFIENKTNIYRALLEGYQADIQQAWQVRAEYETDKVAVFILPDQKWARRVSGVWSNELTNRFPDRAHAVFTHNRLGGYTVSVRAPLSNKIGADELCSCFPDGGGRKAAAGINNLPLAQLQAFLVAFQKQYP